MQSFVTSTRAAFRTALTAGAVALTVAGASLATSAPAEAFVRHGGGFHHGGFGGFHRFGGFGGARFGGHRFGYGYGRHLGGYGFRRGIVGDRAFGLRRFAYGVGLPSYGFRRCSVGRHFVPGLGCRLNAVYGYGTFGYGVRRIVRPVFGVGYGVPRFGYAFGRHFGGYGHGFRHGGFGGFHHAGFGHGGHFRRH